MKKWPPVENGRRVVTAKELPHNFDRSYVPEAVAVRRMNVEGTIVHYHDSHGLCYEVKHDDDKVVACYDPDELFDRYTGLRLDDPKAYS